MECSAKAWFVVSLIANLTVGTRLRSQSASPEVRLAGFPKRSGFVMSEHGSGHDHGCLSLPINVSSLSPGTLV
jgi:hypothetical protein